MAVLDKDIAVYCNSQVVENIINNEGKIVGVESDLTIINEHRKYVGLVLLVTVPKFSLGDYIEFNTKKIKWTSSNYNENMGFYLIDPYWCKKWAPEPIIDIPCKVYRPKTNTTETEFIRLTYKQFIRRRLLEFYGDWKYRYVAAIINFDKLRYKGYWAAINPSVKHFFVSPDVLKSLIAKRNRQIAALNNEWNKRTESSKKLAVLFNKIKTIESNKNVIEFKK